MKLSWGWKIAILYSVFVAGMVALVTASSRQDMDLVSKNYYQDEVAYQKVLDAARNQAGLSSPFTIHANETAVVVGFPAEFNEKVVKGTVRFYSPVNAAWDKSFVIDAAHNETRIARSELRKTKYVIKVDCEVDGKKYYQESELQLHQ